MEPILAQSEATEVRLIERAYRLRAYLTPAQARLLRRLFGARRRIWNWALSTRQEARSQGERLTWVDLSKRITALKQDPEFAWLQELPRDPFEQTLRDQERGLSNFFAGRARFPRRKRYGSVNSTRFTLDQRRQQVRSDPNPRWCRVSLPGRRTRVRWMRPRAASALGRNRRCQEEPPALGVECAGAEGAHRVIGEPVGEGNLPEPEAGVPAQCA